MRLKLALFMFCLAGAAHAQAPPPEAAAPPPATERPAPFAREIAAFTAQDQVSPPPTCAFLFVGSSTIRRWNSLTADFRPMTVLNRGFGGAQISHVNLYFNETVGRYRPRAIVFFAGDNDINAGKTGEQAFADFSTFMDLKTAALGPTPVYVISAKPSPIRLADLPQQADFNRRLKAFADDRADLVYLDIVPLMMGPDGAPKDIFFEDRLHMRSNGYDLWIPVVKAALSRPMPTPAPGC
jgi:hypothetical protein